MGCDGNVLHCLQTPEAVLSLKGSREGAVGALCLPCDPGTWCIVWLCWMPVRCSPGAFVECACPARKLWTRCACSPIPCCPARLFGPETDVPACGPEPEQAAGACCGDPLLSTVAVTRAGRCGRETDVGTQALSLVKPFSGISFLHAS